jgi:putative redox protein
VDVTLTATAHSVEGTLRQDVLIRGRHRLTTDEPERLGGDDTAAAPHELLPAALAACIGTSLAMYARTKHWDLGDVTVAVDYDHRGTPRKFEIRIDLTAELTSEQRMRLEKVVATCPLRRSLETGFVFAEQLNAMEGGELDVNGNRQHRTVDGREPAHPRI